MHIAIFGNTNNYPLLLAQGFRQLGVSVKLFINRKELLHRPESKIPNYAIAYPDWIYDCSNIAEDDFVCESSRIGDVINALVSGSDGVILNHLGPSLTHLIEKPSIAFLTGSDLTYYGDYETITVREASWGEDYKRSPGALLIRRHWERFVGRQRAGIAAAKRVSFPWPGLVAEGDRLLSEIGVLDQRRFFIFMADTLNLQYCPPPKNRVLRLFNGARLNWHRPLPPGFSAQDDKGTDILLKGFAQFISTGGRAELRLVRKGLHISETDRLVRDLGIENNVVWLDELPLAEFYNEMRQADVVCDQFGTAVPGMVSVDGMAIGRPILGNFRLDIIQPRFREDLPVCHTETSEAVVSQLHQLSESHARRLEIGRAAHEFSTRWMSPETTAKNCLESLLS